MDGGLNLASIRRVAPARGWVVRAVDFDYFSSLVLDHGLRGNKVAITQPHFAARRQAVVLLGRIFAEIVLLDVEHFRKWHLALAGAFVLGIIDRFHFIDLALREV